MLFRSDKDMRLAFSKLKRSIGPDGIPGYIFKAIDVLIGPTTYIQYLVTIRHLPY